MSKRILEKTVNNKARELVTTFNAKAKSMSRYTGLSEKFCAEILARQMNRREK